MTKPAQPLTGLLSLALVASMIVLLSPAPASAVPASRAAALENWLVMMEGTRVSQAWTGNVAGCVVGTQSQASIDATVNAVNTLRDFAGVAPVSFDPALNRSALAAALMMKAANRLSHHPGPDWPCYSPEGASGANSSNLSSFDPSGAASAIGDVADLGVPSLGHRLGLLHPHSTVFGTGSTGTTNALVTPVPQKAAPTVPEVVAWPPPGHLPWPLVKGTWSAVLNVAGTIDASAVQVQVSINGRPVPVSVLTRGAIMRWDVALAESDRDADARIDVAIGGITVDGVPRQFSYAINTIRADTPIAGKISATRTRNSVEFAWQAATERGVAITGYRIYGFTLGGHDIVFNQTVGPQARRATLPDTAPSQHLGVTVSPLSRAGSPREDLLLLMPGATAPPAGVGSRARFVGRVTLKLVRPGRLRAGSRLKVRADVRGERRLRYQWRRNGRSMRGATHSTYRVRRIDRGQRITCRLTAVGTDGVGVKRTSSARVIPRR